MSDEEVAGLYHLALEFWARQEPLPDELKTQLAAIPEEQKYRVWDQICKDAET